MSYQQNMPQLGATFVPGGFDDYYMPAPSPEVISPAPQRFVLLPLLQDAALSNASSIQNPPGCARANARESLTP